MDLLDPKASPNDAYVSTGALPPVEQVRALVAEAHERFATVGQGQVSQVYPALARVDPALFGICVVDATGGIVSVGQAGHEFTIMSVSKPFVFALVCDLIGATGARERLGTAFQLRAQRHKLLEQEFFSIQSWEHPALFGLFGSSMDCFL